MSDGKAAAEYKGRADLGKDAIIAIIRSVEMDGYAHSVADARAYLARLEAVAEAAIEYERLLALDDIELDPAKNWPAIHTADDKLRDTVSALLTEQEGGDSEAK